MYDREEGDRVRRINTSYRVIGGIVIQPGDMGTIGDRKRVIWDKKPGQSSGCAPDNLELVSRNETERRYGL